MVQLPMIFLFSLDPFPEASSKFEILCEYSAFQEPVYNVIYLQYSSDSGDGVFELEERRKEVEG